MTTDVESQIRVQTTVRRVDASLPRSAAEPGAPAGNRGARIRAVELFATRTHFDYHNPAAVADLQQWLAEAGLELHGIHAPMADSFVGGRWGAPLTLASADADAREHAVDEAERALHIARRIPAKVLVAHLGLPPHAELVARRTTAATARGAASRSCSSSRRRSASRSPSK